MTRHGRWRALLPEPALLLALGGRAWQSLAGLGTIYFVVEHFTPETQGYYHTFMSLVALQSFVELGMLVAIISIVSHEWAGLEGGVGRVVAGAAEKRLRLASATRFVALWFSAMALLLLIGGGWIGYLVLEQHGRSEMWLAPWIVTISIASLFLWCQGQIAVLEGCNQVLEVAVYRLVQGVAGSAALWLAILSGAGLWSLAVMLGVNLLAALILLGVAYGRFLADLLLCSARSTFRWRTDIWPMQWPLALQGVTNYFMFSLFVPVAFSYHGAVEAGRLGLSLQVVTALVAIATTWLTVSAPRMGTAFAGGDVDRFENLWRKAAAVSSFLALAAAAVVAMAGFAAHQQGWPVAARFVEPVPFLLLLAWGVLLHLVQCMASYWRAQRREPLRLLGIVPGLVTGVAIWLLGSHYGALGAAAGAFAAFSLIGIPLGLYFLIRSRALVSAIRRGSTERPQG